MVEVHEEDELPPSGKGRDRELTLGPMLLTGLFLGLLLVCGLCFLAGFWVGNRGGHAAVATQPADAPASTDAAGQQAKPESAPAAAPTIAQPPAQPDSSAVASTPAPASALMVQIATVSAQEDADVLAAALRKRGYAVTVSQQSADGQLHVSVGPYASSQEAEAARQKLLNDGYNAVVQP
jgi:septal ring-binding cell division protein DamX